MDVVHLPDLMNVTSGLDLQVSTRYVLHVLSAEGEGVIMRPDRQPDLSPPRDAGVKKVTLHLCLSGMVLVTEANGNVLYTVHGRDEK
jgi:hypothetical protein